MCQELEFSASLPLTIEQAEFASTIITRMDELYDGQSDQDMEMYFKGDQHMEIAIEIIGRNPEEGIDFDIQFYDGKAYLQSCDWNQRDLTVKFIQKMLNHFDVDKPVEINARSGYGGLAYFITRDKCEELSTYVWLREKRTKFKEREKNAKI